MVGAPSAAWGETPVAFVVLREGASIDAEDAARLGQRRGSARRSGLRRCDVVDALPRSAIGKVLKRELRDLWLR